MTTNTKLALIATLSIAAYVYRDEIRRALFNEHDAEGWYVKLFNYPPGNRDRRLKLVEGPYDTKAEAEDVAAELEDVWYPQVAYAERNPLLAGPDAR